MENGRPERGPGLGAGCRRILLVGFMGSGKSTVGALLASRLGWSFFDFDVEVERRAGLSVPEIFRRRGESFFRQLEVAVARELLLAEHAVLASGGGWPAAAGRMDEVGPGTLSVWLRVRPETSVARALGGAPRPLLEGADPLGRARRLLGEREPFYRRAEVHLDGDGASPEELVEAILRHVGETARARPGR